MKCPTPALRSLGLIVAALLLLSLSASAQRGRGQSASGPGTVSRVAWSKDSKLVSFNNQKKRYEFDVKTLQRSEIKADKTPEPARPSRRRTRRGSTGASTGKYVGRPGRGRQYKQVDSPDG